MKIVFLVINYMPHQLVAIKSVIDIYKAEVHAFNYKDDHTIPQSIKGLITYSLNDFNKRELVRKILEIKPELLVSAGWFVNEYVWAAKKIHKQLKIPTVVYSDTQWQGSFRQKVNCFISPFHLKKAFTHIWVAGIYQFEYARKLGFKKNEIIFNALSCDVELFNKVNIEIKKDNYPKNFLFIGRYIEIKGLKYLLDAWSEIPDKKGWTLTLIGDGPLKTSIQKSEDIIIKDFMSQPDLISEMSKAGCFILPSYFEQWSLVMHEAATAGLPIITTEVCGASPHFVVNGFNGYQIEEKSTDDIKITMERIINTNDNELIKFSQNSRKLASSITPELGAANLLGVLFKK